MFARKRRLSTVISPPYQFDGLSEARLAKPDGSPLLRGRIAAAKDWADHRIRRLAFQPDRIVDRDHVSRRCLDIYSKVGRSA